MSDLHCHWFQPLRRTVFWFVWTAALVLGFVLPGCSAGVLGGGGIDSLHVFGVPVALDLDGLPGPDGLGVTIYASASSVAKGVAIGSGRLEVLMFDEDGSTRGTASKESLSPRHVWKLTPADLKRHSIKTSLGVGYRLTPGWGDTPPRRTWVTVVVRYVPSHGDPIESSPVTIAVTTK